ARAMPEHLRSGRMPGLPRQSRLDAQILAVRGTMRGSSPRMTMHRKGTCTCSYAAEGFLPSADKFRRWVFGSGLGHLQPLALAAEGRGPPPVIPVAILLRASVGPARPASH